MDSEIAQLRQKIAYYDKKYYREASPEISDFAYDQLKRELAELERQTSLSTDSPTQSIGDDRSEGFVTHLHRQPMLSLDNTYNQKELFEFDQRLKKLLHTENALSYLIEPKIDGVAINLLYEKGTLIRALTRGNGMEGDDVTQNIKTITSLPLQLIGPSLPDLLEIRGEVYMTLSEFKRINQKRDADGLPLYANPRNLTAGTIKLLDPSETAQRKLDIVLHGIGDCDPPLFTHQSTFHKLIHQWQLPSLEKFWQVVGIEEAWECIQKLNLLRNDFPYQTDGAVIKLDNLALQAQVGQTAKAPRGVIAYKFSPERAETRLYKITIQVGRTGALTPVAELEPIVLAGTTVSRATLHNADEIARKDIREGDTVTVEKAGDIIPAVVEVIQQKRPEKSVPFVFPTHCPACKTEAVRLPEETAWRCPNAVCPPQVRNRIFHYGSRQAMDIENLGSSTVSQLVESGLLHDIADLYTLKEEALLPLENFAQKSAENLIASIDKSKAQPLWRMLHGLGIANVGVKCAKDLARHFKTIDALSTAKEEELVRIDGIGSTIACSVIHFFSKETNQKMVERLKEYGVSPEPDHSAVETSAPFSGKTFVLTGTLPNLTREQAVTLIEERGGKVSSSVSKKTSYVLVGESAGSKLAKAQKLGVPLLNEEAFRKLL